MIKIEELLKHDYAKWKDREYIYEKINGNYKSITFGNFIEKSVYFAEYLLSKELKDKKIVIFADNSIKWMIADIAIMAYVGESVTISKEWKYEQVFETLSFLDISCLIYDNSKKEIIDKIKKDFPNIIYISIEVDFEKVINIGKEINLLKEDMFNFEPKDIDKCSKIIFTSGTTSSPKAVMLSLKNIFAGYNSLERRCDFDEKDICYLFLPLTHTYGNIYNFIYSLISGYKIYLASSISNICKELLEVNPTIFCGVPLIYMKLYENYKENIDKAFGNNIKYLFSGGAYFNEKVRKIYKDKKLNLMEAYALSETASSLAIEYPYSDDTKSVGTIFEDIDVKINESDENGVGEIIVKGDNIFLGYANNKELTNLAFTNDGYFKTGDIGYIENNKIYICGRKKKIIIGSNGEKITPEIIEEKIKKLNSIITNVKVFIRQGKLVANVYIKEETNIDWKILFNSLNETLPKYERIKEFEIIIDSLEKRLKQ